MEKVLFIIVSFSRGGPQALRFQKIFEFLKLSKEIHVIELHHHSAEDVYEKGIWLHKIEYSKLGKHLHADYTRKIESSPERNNNRIKIIKSRIKKTIRNQFFPDTFIFEKSLLQRKVLELMHIHNFSTVVASGFPFTTMILSQKIKRFYPESKFIYDIGDPFYNNSHNGLLRNRLAKIFELKYLRFIDRLVVTNNITKSHYLKNFSEMINSERIVIVPQGVPAEILNMLDKKSFPKENIVENNKLKLVYAGQFYLKLREPFQLFSAVRKWNDSTSNPYLTLDLYGSFSDIFKISGSSISLINFRGKVSNTAVLEAYMAGDIIIFIDNAFGLQTPGKVFEVAAIGKPVLFISDHPKSPAYDVIKGLKHIYLCTNKWDSIIKTIRLINFNIDYSSIYDTRKDFAWEKRALQYNLILSSN